MVYGNITVALRKCLHAMKTWNLVGWGERAEWKEVRFKVVEERGGAEGQ